MKQQESFQDFLIENNCSAIGIWGTGDMSPLVSIYCLYSLKTIWLKPEKPAESMFLTGNN